jgi:hypothetical protein
MSDRPEISGTESRSETVRPSLPSSSDRRVAGGADRSAQSLDLIACDGCGRTFVTPDGAGMIAAIVGPCPDCGGRFQLADSLPRGTRL